MFISTVKPEVDEDESDSSSDDPKWQSNVPELEGRECGPDCHPECSECQSTAENDRLYVRDLKAAQLSVSPSFQNFVKVAKRGRLMLKKTRGKRRKNPIRRARKKARVRKAAPAIFSWLPLI